MTDIKRAVDEEAVKRMLTTCYATFSELDAMNIALICTQSDVSKSPVLPEHNAEGLEQYR